MLRGEHSLKEYYIDGETFRSLSEFYKVFGTKVIEGYCCPNFNAFNDVLRGGFGTPAEGFVLNWRNSKTSEKALGADIYWRLVNIIRNHGPDGNEAEDNVYLRLL